MKKKIKRKPRPKIEHIIRIDRMYYNISDENNHLGWDEINVVCVFMSAGHVCGGLFETEAGIEEYYGDDYWCFNECYSYSKISTKK